MSLSNLKRSTRLDRPELTSVDQFIDGALLYANGHKRLHAQEGLCLVPPASQVYSRKMKRATFTLSDDTIIGLNHLAQITGIAKSRIIRILVQQQTSCKEHNGLTECKTK